MRVTNRRSIVVGRAQAADQEKIKALLEGASLPLDGIEACLESTIVARSDRAILGTAALEIYGDAALLRSVAVAAEHRGDGLGGRLTQAALDLASHRGVREVYLLTETADDYFTRFGFEPIERPSIPIALYASAELRGACPESARAMRLRLDPSDAGATADPDLHEAVRARYAASARQVLLSPTGSSSCCGGAACCGGGEKSAITSDLYGSDQAASLPETALRASLGCGNPTALIDLRPGQTVLDLGSGGGIDVLLSARRVGPTGKAYGVDMTDEMLELARQNAAEAGATNVEFLKGRIESVPLPNDSVDVVISNCVINLAPDKRDVLREAFRVLKPGGRFAVSDVVVDGPVPDDLRRRVELWVGCIAGALDRGDYATMLRDVGFVDVEITPTRHYDASDATDPALRAWIAAQPADEQARLARAFMSAFVRATKPAR